MNQRTNTRPSVDPQDDWNTWRVIVEFPGYMISPGGEVRNHRTGQLIRPVFRGGNAYVRLFRNGASYNRGVQKLIDITFPPLDPTEVLDDWIEIPGYETYEINRYGRVRRTSTKRPLKIVGESGRYVNLSAGGKTVRLSIRGLLALVGYV